MNRDPNDLYGARPATPGMSAQPDVHDEGTRDMRSKVQHLAGRAQEKVGEQVKASVDTGKHRAADTLHDVARKLIDTAEQSGGPGARYIHQAGDQMQRLSDFLEQTDVRDMMQRTERFARRQPALFLGGAFFVGVLAARFMKNSRRAEDKERRDEQREAQGRSEVQRYEREYDRERPLPGYREAAPAAGWSASGDRASDVARPFTGDRTTGGDPSGSGPSAGQL